MSSSSRSARRKNRRMPIAIVLGGGYGPRSWKYTARFLSWLIRGRVIEPPGNEELTLQSFPADQEHHRSELADLRARRLHLEAVGGGSRRDPPRRAASNPVPVVLFPPRCRTPARALRHSRPTQGARFRKPDRRGRSVASGGSDRADLRRPRPQRAPDGVAGQPRFTVGARVRTPEHRVAAAAEPAGGFRSVSTTAARSEPPRARHAQGGLRLVGHGGGGPRARRHRVCSVQLPRRLPEPALGRLCQSRARSVDARARESSSKKCRSPRRAGSSPTAGW